MRILNSNYVFPSYNKLREEIVQKKVKNYQNRIGRLTQKLAQMHKTNDFTNDHEMIKDSIICLSQQNMCSKNES